MSEGTPYHSLLAERLYEADVAVGKGAELLYHGLLGVGVFVSSDVYLLAHEYGILTLEVLGEEGVEEGVEVVVEEVEVIHTILLRAELLAIMGEGE